MRRSAPADAHAIILRNEASIATVPGFHHFDEALALASSRPVLLVAPTLDRYARIADVRAEVQAVPGVTLETPVDFNRFGRTFQARVANWLAASNR